MMVPALRAIACSLFVVASSGAFAETADSISRPNIAAALCPSEWAVIEALDPDLWGETNPIPIDPSLDADLTHALNKYFVSIMAMAETMGATTGLLNPLSQTRSKFDLAAAKYHLSLCLTLTEPERDLIVDAASERHEHPKDVIHAKLFQAFENYTCARFPEASAQIFQLDPDSDTFSADYQEIMASTLIVCG